MKIGCIVLLPFSEKENGFETTNTEEDALLAIDYLSIESIHPAWRDGKKLRCRSFIRLNKEVMGKKEIMVYGDQLDVVNKINHQINVFQVRSFAIAQQKNY